VAVGFELTGPCAVFFVFNDQDVDMGRKGIRSQGRNRIRGSGIRSQESLIRIPDTGDRTRFM
jgi:hypothetical protein